MRRILTLGVITLLWAAGPDSGIRAEAPTASTVTSESIIRLPASLRAKQVTPVFTTIVPESIGGINEVQEIACVVRVTRDGKGVKGVKAQYVLRAFETPLPVTVLRQGRARSNKQGWMPIPITNTTGDSFDSVIVQTTLSTSKRVDGIYVRCQHRDFDSCDDCFGPDRRFRVQSPVRGWVLNGPSEIQNGPEIWTFEVEDACNIGAHYIDIENIAGRELMLEDVSLVDIKTGINLTSDPTANPSWSDGQRFVSPSTCP